MRCMADRFKVLRLVLDDTEYVDHDNRDNALCIYKSELHKGCTHYDALIDCNSMQCHEVAFLHDFGEGLAVMDDYTQELFYDDIEDTKPQDTETIKKTLKNHGFKYLIVVDGFNIKKVIKL